MLFAYMKVIKIFRSRNKMFINDSDHFNYQKLHNEIIEKYSEMLKFIPNNFKTQEAFEKAIKKDLSALAYAPACYRFH